MQLEVTKVKLEIYTPEEVVKTLRDELTKIGACKVGDYDYVVSFQESKGYWRPLEDSDPFEGEKGKINFGTEIKMEVLCSADLVKTALDTIKKIHPYEEPVVNIIPILDPELFA